MDGRDKFLLLARMACTGLALASLVIFPSPTRGAPVPAACRAAKAATYVQLVCGPATMAVHVSGLRRWWRMRPHHHFAYTMVVFQWILTAIYSGTASAAWAVITDPDFPHLGGNCGGSFRAICRRYWLSMGLAFLMAILNVVVSLVLNAAWLSHPPRFSRRP